nr:PAS domain-containing protein [Desulfobacterales bacterium]
MVSKKNLSQKKITPFFLTDPAQRHLNKILGITELPGSKQNKIFSMLYNLGCGIIIGDQDRNLLFFNKAMGSLSGWKPEEAIGRKCFETFHSCNLAGDYMCDSECFMQRILNGEARSLRGERSIGEQKGKYGKRRLLSCNYSCIEEPAGKKRHVIVTSCEFCSRDVLARNKNMIRGEPLNIILDFCREIDIIPESPTFHHDLRMGIIGESEAVKLMRDFVRRVSSAKDVTVLIEGESGTGKEMVARAIHRQSTRGKKPLVALNCGAIPRELVEAELFGYESGSFTGALAGGKKGKFELADGGTLLLDEISTLSMPAQATLLRVLEAREFYSIGGSEKKRVNLRVIATSNQDLKELVSKGSFRKDLYYRLSVACIKIPPLRERKEDILPLAYHFIKESNRKFGRSIERICPSAQELLLAHPWEGNVRELKNVIQRAFVLEIQSEEDTLLPRHLSTHLTFPPLKRIDEPVPSCNAIVKALLGRQNFVLEEFLVSLFKEALRISGGNLTRAARMLGVSRPTMRYRLKKYRIQSRSDVF